MDFLTNPIVYHHLLDEHGLLDDIYKSVSAMDMSAAVIAALKVMRFSKTLPTVTNTEKNPNQSQMYRTEGTDHFSKECYLQALECFNKALLFAPKGSPELLLAYSARSALLFKIKAYSGALEDIETCFKLGCKGDRAIKLNKIKDASNKLESSEKLKNHLLVTGFPQEFFKFGVKKHTEVPCLSADVDVVTVACERRVVAANNIKVGTVIALEQAFTTYSGDNKSRIACYYCQKVAVNLTPCDTCCYALFCSKECKMLCLEQYHETECQIMDVLETINVGHRFRLAVKTALKLKTNCNGWSKLIEESENIGASRLKASSVSQAYNGNNYSSILCFKEDRHFVHGAVYNSCFVYATVIHYLEKVSGFFPEAPVERLKAKKCFAKLCMSLETMCPFVTEMKNSADLPVGEIWADVASHWGWFAFTGKLKHSCESNVIALGLNSSVALVAIQPIKKMSEITVSYVGHYYEHVYGDKRAMKIYQATLNACNCRVCEDSWGLNFYTKDLSTQQKKVLYAWQKLTQPILRHKDPGFFKETCHALAVLKDLVNTTQHATLFTELLFQLGVCQLTATI